MSKDAAGVGGEEPWGYGDASTMGDTSKPRIRRPNRKKAPEEEPTGPRIRKDGQPDKRYAKGRKPPGRKVPAGMEPRKPGQRLKPGEERRQPVHLSPIQLRALDSYFDPAMHSVEDVARATGIHPRTLRGWLANHPKFLDEWKRRASIFVEGFASHTIRSAIAAMDVLVEIARDKALSPEHRISAADKILRATHGLKVQVDVLAQHQHVHAVVPVSPSAGSGGASTPPASIQRLTGPAGSSPGSVVGALQVELRELSVMVEQVGAGALTTLDQLQDAEATGFVEGEAS